LMMSTILILLNEVITDISFEGLRDG